MCGRAGKWNKHVDAWDAITDNEFVSAEGLAFVLKQLFQVAKPPNRFTPEYCIMKKFKDWEIRRRASAAWARQPALYPYGRPVQGMSQLVAVTSSSSRALRIGVTRLIALPCMLCSPLCSARRASMWQPRARMRLSMWQPRARMRQSMRQPRARTRRCVACAAAATSRSSQPR